jgi:hypothetical protein
MRGDFVHYSGRILRSYKQLCMQPRFRAEAGKNTSTVALRVGRGYEKGTQCPGYNWAILFLGDIINTGTWSSRLGESQMRGHLTTRNP